MKKFGKVILQKENRCRCVLHTWQIAVKAACEVIQNKTAIICNVNIKLQSSKVQRAVFREKAMSILGKQWEVPEGDNPTCWNLTFKMNLHLLHMKDVITATLDDPRISSDFCKEEKPTPDM